MKAYTLINGRLTRLVKELKGIEVQTISIYPSGESCEIFIYAKPDKEGGEIVSIDARFTSARSQRIPSWNGANFPRKSKKCTPG